MAKIMASDKWLRSAVQEGIDEIEQGEGIEFASINDLADHIREIGEEASRDWRPERCVANERRGLVSGIAFSRNRVTGGIVKEPPHFPVFRIGAARLEILRVVHYSRDLARHLSPG